MYRYLFFDLDGTLTDSKEGIFNCLTYAFRKMNKPVPPESMLIKFIGPPMQDALMEILGFTAEEAQEGLRLFRERFSTKLYAIHSKLHLPKHLSFYHPEQV